MARSARDAYLENEIRTATPQRLRLMLLDGAIRFCLTAKDALASSRDDDADRAFDRAHQILAELLSGIRPGYDVGRQVASLYVFLIRELSAARSQRSTDTLDGLIEVLEIERETWRQVCESVTDRVEGNAPSGKEILARDAERILAKRQGIPASALPASPASGGSFRIEA
ncbi:MAG TPA: flagellar protein FliS [Pirellulaceae bacterium]|nr:flagellar protein FliS [Pirellulaceae bacterium]